MAAELDKLAEYYRQKANIPRANLYAALAAEEIVIGGPKTLTVSNKEIIQLDLVFEWQRQARKLIDLGFYKVLSLSQDQYLASLPKFDPQPEDFRGRFDIPVLVETRIAPSLQAKLVDLNYCLEGINFSDWEGDPKGYKTPDAPYVTWMQDGKKNLTKAVATVRENLASDERGATVHDGIGLFIAHPEILKGHYIDLPGTSVGPDNAPYLFQWVGRPRLNYYWVGNAHSSFGSASCGRV